MISRTESEQILYDARLKFQLDQEANLEGARREGMEIGLRKGELRGRIGLLRQLLGLTTADDLSTYSEDQLSKIENELQSQLRGRGL